MKSINSISKIQLSLFALLFLFLASCGSAKKTGDDLIADAMEERTMVQQNYPEMSNQFQNAYAYAIFPNVGKGAYIIGGASGNGVVYQNGNVIGYSDLKQIDIGLQVGGKAFVEVLLFENQAALDRFKSGTYELSANASAIILDKGVSKDISFEDGVAVVTVPKEGVMAGITVGGQRFTYTPVNR